MSSSSKRAKGLSFDDKRKAMLELLWETADFWSLKELEKMAPKAKGIIAQSVKEVLDALVSDGMVVCEKIGTGNYYWRWDWVAGDVHPLRQDAPWCISVDEISGH